jgi:signal transduction histidine kinase
LFLLLNGVTIGLALIIQWMFVSRALKPFTQLSHEMFMLGRGGRAVATVTDLPKPDEVKRLIALVQRRLERSRNAIGNLAHGIKTPLAMLFRLAQAPALAENPELSQDITRYAESIRQLIESELRRARLAGSGHVTQTLNPFQALSGLVKMVRTIHAEKPLDFTVQASNEPVAFDLQDFMELMGNLLDNAAKWAEEQIAVHVQQKDGDLYVTVEDDGIGCTEEQMQGLTQRGVRLDETREGHGLGLSIVRDLVDQYHGALTLSRSVDLGGLRVAAILKMDPR